MKTAFEGMKNITICGDTVTIKSTMKDEDIANMRCWQKPLSNI